MKIPAKPIATLLTILVVCSCSGPGKNEGNKVSTSTVDSIRDSATKARTAAAAPDLKVDEKEFVLRAANGGMLEVEAANVALQKTKNEAVKDFATRMVRDHGLANKELAIIAKAKGISLPSFLPEEQVKQLDNLKEISDRPFDVQYVKMMVEEHNKMLSIYNTGVRLTNPQLKAFAEKTLPAVKIHRELAMELGKALNIKNANQGDDLLNLSPTDDETH